MGNSRSQMTILTTTASRLGPVKRVLLGHVPVVPHETHRVRLPRRGEVFIEDAAELSSAVVERVDGAHVLGGGVGAAAGRSCPR